MADASSSGTREGASLWGRLKRWTSHQGDDSNTDRPRDGSGEAPHADEKTLIDNVLRLRTLEASDIMVPRVDIVAVDVDTPFDQVVKRLIEEGHSRLPVYRDDLDHVLGMVHVKDVLGFVAARRTTTLHKLLRKTLFVAPSTRLLDLLTQMRLQRSHMAFVVDEFGGIDGLITIEDVVEEIVGEIEDEHDETEPAHVLERADGSLIVDARTPIEELEQVLDVKLLAPGVEEDVDTVGGLVAMLAGRVPARGEAIEHPAHLSFEVLDGDGRRIRRLRVRRLPPISDAIDDEG